jgi:hypothetical protein
LRKARWRLSRHHVTSVLGETALVMVVSRRLLRNLLNHRLWQVAAAPPVVEEGALAPVSKPPQPGRGWSSRVAGRG